MTWKDSEDIHNGYKVFRYSEEITEDNYQNALEIGTVESGIQQFADTLYDTNPYYYAVLGIDGDGSLYKLFIPFRNKTISPVAAEYAVSEEDLSAEITGISTETGDDSITISFSADKTGRDLFLYRSSSVIDDLDTLLESSRIANLTSDATEYIDYPVPGILYYYAVFDAELAKLGKFIFEKGKNITSIPAKLELKEEVVKLPDVRANSWPLPYLLLPSELLQGSSLAEPLALISPKKTTLSDATIQALSRIEKNITLPTAGNLEPVLLDEHNSISNELTDLTLNSIISDSFIKHSWAEADKELNDFLNLKRTEKLEKQARFYLGQCYYFQGKFREAFLEFLEAEDAYYVEVQPWLEDIYLILRNNS